MNYPRVKKFWKDNIKDKKNKYNFLDREILNSGEWEKEIDETTTFKDLDELGRKLRKKMYEEGGNTRWLLGLKDFGTENEEKEYYKYLLLDLEEGEREVKLLRNQNNVSKTTIDDYEVKLKALVGDDLTNWETKITKVGTNDKDTTNLRKKVKDLQTAKDNLDKELKDKQQQIVDHRCDTPNNAELNQTKGELDKANKEIISLKEQLDKKSNNPLLNLPNDKDEKEREEEHENNNLNLEQLKSKLSEKRQEIEKLKRQLVETQQSNNHSRQNGSGNPKLFLGIGIGILIAVAFKCLTLIIAKKKKKKQIGKHHY